MYSSNADNQQIKAIESAFFRFDCDDFNNPHDREFYTFLGEKPWGEQLVLGEGTAAEKAQRYIKLIKKDEENENEDDDDCDDDYDEDEEYDDDEDDDDSDWDEEDDEEDDTSKVKGNGLAEWTKHTDFETVAGGYADQFTSVFGTSSEPSLEKVPVGPYFKYRVARIEDINKIDRTWFKRPYWALSLLKGDILVKDRYERIEKKRRTVVLLDDSGSMRDQWKLKMAKSLIMKYLETVLQGDELYFAKFEEDVYGHRILKNEEDVKRFLKRGYEPMRGMTDVEGCAQTTMTDLKKGKFGKHDVEDMMTEVVIINDGDDFVTPSWHPEFKVHSYQLGVTNYNLNKACERTGGRFFNFTHPQYL